MKRNSVIRIFQGIFSAIGLISVVLVISLLVTQPRPLFTLFSVVGIIKGQSLTGLNTNQMITGAAAGIVEALKDPYSQYLDIKTRQQLTERMSGEFGGIGVYVLKDEEGRLRLIAPIEGTPAYKAGVKNNDVLQKINSESVSNMTQDDAVERMRGEPGTQVNLGVYRENEQKELEFDIVREIISVPSVSTQVLPNTNIGYLRLTLFQSHSHTELVDKLNKILQEDQVRALIMDLRDNGGGDFEAALAIASIFLSDKEIVSVADAQGNKKVHSTKPSTSVVPAHIPIVVLVNNNSASASEILAGALRDNQRAVLVGEKTYGKALVQTVYHLPDGGALKLTTGKYFTPQGTDINQIGITPDYVVQQQPNTLEDLQLDKAKEILEEMLRN